MKKGMKVMIRGMAYWDGKEGKIIAIAEDTVISGNKKRPIKEYIVQFDNPKEWGFFARRELKRRM